MRKEKQGDQDKMTNELDTLLNKRKAVPEIPEGMNARIIAEAARTEQIRGAGKRNLSFGGVFVRLFADVFPSPQPAWAAAAAVVILALGFVIGDLIDIGLVETPPEGDELSSFMSVEDSFSIEEWV